MSQSTLRGCPDGTNRVIILLDLDCYEAQVWMNQLRPELANIDVPVVIKNHDDIILALNYSAKAQGVTRGGGRGGLHEARRLCPNLEEIQVPERYGRVDTFYPYTESDSILHVIQQLLGRTDFGGSVILERSSKDEIYMDVTQYAWNKANVGGSGDRQIPQNIYNFIYSTKNNPCPDYHGQPRVVMEGRKRKISFDTLYYRIQQVYTNINFQEAYQDHMNELLLVHGAVLAGQIISAIQRETRYVSSAGVASNKLLSKLACSANKPEGISIITERSLPRIFQSRNFRDIPGYQSKRGNDLEMELMKPEYGFYDNCGAPTTDPPFTFVDIQQLDQQTIYDALCSIGAGQEAAKTDKLHQACRGIDDTPVEDKVYCDTMSISMSFKGAHYCEDPDDLYNRIDELALDMCERLDYSTQQLGRQMQTMSVKVNMCGGSGYQGPRWLDIPYDRNDCVHRKNLRGFARAVAAEIEENYISLERVTFQAKDVIELD